MARTATLGLTNATLAYIARLAEGGLSGLLADVGFLQGLNLHRGLITHPAVAAAFNMPWFDANLALK